MPSNKPSAHGDGKCFGRDAVQMSNQRMRKRMSCLGLGSKEPENDSSHSRDVHQLTNHLRARGTIILEGWMM